MAGGVNLYAYAGNNPIGFSDPYGLCPPCGGDGKNSAQETLVHVLNSFKAELADLAMKAVAVLNTLNPMSQLVGGLFGRDAATGQPASAGASAIAVVGAVGDMADGPVPTNAILGAWHKGTFADEAASAAYHLNKHGDGRSLGEYTQDATSFFGANKGRGVQMTAKDGTGAMRIRTPGGGPGGIFTSEGKVITFWYK